MIKVKTGRVDALVWRVGVVPTPPMHHCILDSEKTIKQHVQIYLYWAAMAVQ